ncbi:MAG: AAA family ATPase [Deltaproteobacteria bacterium]|nr:AAA family ATPase [Deltaproteobacteria bacterium]
MLTKFKIQNYRCFEEFYLEGIKPITLISGNNNVGKTSLLESIHLFTEKNNQNIFRRLNFNYTGRII